MISHAMLQALFGFNRAMNERLWTIILQTLTDDDLNAEQIDGLPPDERYWKAIAAATWWSYPAVTGPLRQFLKNAPRSAN